MSRWRLSVLLLVLCGEFACLGGCSDVAKPPPRFQIDPEKAAQEAMRLYDKNGDGTLDAKELEASPPLQELLLNLQKRDSAHPASLNSDDIQKRLAEWLEDSAILVPAQFMVYLDGQMLEGATVSFEPEPFLGSSYHAHRGTTNAAGMVAPDPELPNYPSAIYVGLYRIRISKIVKGKETIPAKYNSQTILGRELASGTRDSHENIFFRLTSK